jgi:glycosyltransferase involved in cell wall biosynthesis
MARSLPRAEPRRLRLDLVTQIVGIVLARDEDVWVEQAVRSVLEFCDQVVLCDHRSRDRTSAILRALAAEHPHLSYTRIRNPKASHDAIKELAGSDTWVLSADADEIYDRERLAAFRIRLLAGDYDQWWAIRLSMLHCAVIDFEGRTATGWLAPPARSGAKLFNFAAISAWEGPTTQRLHGGTPIFRPSRTNAVHHVGEHYGWDDAPFRCLHVCFMRRSSSASPRELARQSYGDRLSAGRPRRVWFDIKRLVGRPHASWWKVEKYARGELVTLPIDGFMPTERRGCEVAPILGCAEPVPGKV